MPDHPAPAAPVPFSDAIALGPDGLGLVVSASARPGPDGALVRRAVADPALEGPPGVLQGGFASLLPMLVARLDDRHGAPLTRLDVRLRAPTPLGRELEVGVRATGTATHAVVVTLAGDAPDAGRVLVEAEVEFAGAEPLTAATDLVALGAAVAARAEGDGADDGADDGTDDAAGGPEGAGPHPTCFVCGRDATHGLALRLPARAIGPDAVGTTWVADAALTGSSVALVRGASADEPGAVDDLVVAAVLDCVSARAALPVARAGGAGGVVLGTFGYRVVRPVPVLDPLRVVARAEAPMGRRHPARAAVVDDEGTVLAAASVVHVAVEAMPSLRSLRRPTGT